LSKKRFLFLKIIIILMLIAILFRLYNMQIINGAGYKNLSDQRISAGITKKAPRGEIVDRNGKAMVTNRKGYSLIIKKTDMKEEAFNKMLLNIIHILKEDGQELPNLLPITESKPYDFTFQTDNEKSNWLKNNNLDINIKSADDVISYYKKIFNLEKFSEEESRIIAGIRYDMKNMSFSYNNPYTIATDVSIPVISKIKENSENFVGVSVSNDYFREYANGNLAAHILGRVGKIYKEEYDELKNKGYKINDVVGKEGIEKAFESYLKGVDGTESSFYGKDKELLGDNIDVSAVPGNYVVLTIDAELQKVAEESLEKNIKQISSAGNKSYKNGGDCNAGAAVVIDVNTGEILAMASYPTFNPKTFSENYDKLINDPAKPLWNRAISGTYTPGSTFKPLTAIAALSTGAIKPNETITCKGIYTFYSDYQPSCWIWSEQHLTHGIETVSKAIVDSCNYFFYEVGRRTGIDAISEYARKFGLCDKTGIEIQGENKGNVSSPDYKKTLYQNEDDKKWVAGDTIQTAIGQSYSNFTPICIANYVATIANGGRRFRPHIIKSIRSTVDGSFVFEEGNNIIEDVGVSEDVLNIVKEGMLGVTDEGSAKKIFSDYPINVAGKTGTAQISKTSSNNALFVSFAPYDKPEIAVCVVLEHGFRGANAAYVARDIYDKYFALDNKQIKETKPTKSDYFSNLLP